MLQLYLTNVEESVKRNVSPSSMIINLYLLLSSPYELKHEENRHHENFPKILTYNYLRGAEPFLRRNQFTQFRCISWNLNVFTTARHWHLS